MRTYMNELEKSVYFAIHEINKGRQMGKEGAIFYANDGWDEKVMKQLRKKGYKVKRKWLLHKRWIVT